MKTYLLILPLFFLLLFSTTLVAQQESPFRSDRSDVELDIKNGDILKCLVQSAKGHGWKLIKAYYDPQGKLVLVFLKDGRTKTYISRD